MKEGLKTPSLISRSQIVLELICDGVEQFPLPYKSLPLVWFPWVGYQKRMLCLCMYIAQGFL